jgi:Domain of unknown function (DUF4290)
MFMYRSSIAKKRVMNHLDMAYNTSQEVIKFPEYGRSVEQLLDHAKTIENTQHRQDTVDAIFKIILTLNPGTSTRNFDDFKERVWNHMFKMTNYELNVKAPNGVVIRREEEKSKPEPVAYPVSDSRFRHYGNNVKTLIEKAIAMEDGPKKEGLVEVIGSYMKLAYKTWAREHFVSDDVVKTDLEYLSDGKLTLHENYNSLDLLAAGIHNRRDLQNNTNQGGRPLKSGRSGTNRTNGGQGGSGGTGRTNRLSGRTNNGTGGNNKFDNNKRNRR